MFEYVDAEVIGILIAHFGAFGSGELKGAQTMAKNYHPISLKCFCCNVLTSNIMAYLNNLLKFNKRYIQTNNLKLTESAYKTYICPALS